MRLAAERDGETAPLGLRATTTELTVRVCPTAQITSTNTYAAGRNGGDAVFWKM